MAITAATSLRGKHGERLRELVLRVRPLVPDMHVRLLQLERSLAAPITAFPSPRHFALAARRNRAWALR